MRRLLVPAALILFVGGCGGGSAKVTGKVTYQGRPVLSGAVIMVNEDGTAASGVIAPDGTYTVEGVKRGHVKIGVTSPYPARAHYSILNAEGKEAHDHAKEGHGPGKEGHPKTKPGANGWYPLPTNLGDPEKSGLVCDVTSSRVQYDIDAK